MKEIKTRIKSVESTKQITKAMELVSSSKFRKAKERAESARPYFNTLYNTVQDIAKNTSNSRNVFLKERKVNNVCYIVIAGDRGLAGGYNSNILKAVIAHNKLGTGKVIPVGKKAKESLSKRGYEVIDYIEYLKFSYMTKAPDDLIIKDDKDLLEKLKKGMEDTDNGKVCSVEEAYEEVKGILAN